MDGLFHMENPIYKWIMTGVRTPMTSETSILVFSCVFQEERTWQHQLTSHTYGKQTPYQSKNIFTFYHHPPPKKKKKTPGFFRGKMWSEFCRGHEIWTIHQEWSRREPLDDSDLSQLAGFCRKMISFILFGDYTQKSTLEDFRWFYPEFFSGHNKNPKKDEKTSWCWTMWRFPAHHRATPSHHPFKWDFPWNKPTSYGGTPMAMETCTWRTSICISMQDVDANFNRDTELHGWRCMKMWYGGPAKSEIHQLKTVVNIPMILIGFHPWWCRISLAHPRYFHAKISLTICLDKLWV